MSEVISTKINVLKFTDLKLYYLVMLFVFGNVFLPFVLHFFGNNLGSIFLPIYFFSLFAGVKFGWRTGFLTAIFSPIISFYFSSMPAISVLPFVMLKSVLLGTVSGLLMKKMNKIFLTIFLTIVITQACGVLTIYLFTNNLNLSMNDFLIGWRGLLIQLILLPLIVNAIKIKPNEN